MYEDLVKELDAIEKQEIKQKLKTLLYEGKKCEDIVENLEQWEIDVIGRIYGTTSKSKICSILVKKLLPLELIREVFLYSNPKDVVSWEKSEFMDDRTFMRKKDSDLVKAAESGNLLGVKYLIDKGDKNKALQKAAEFGHLEIVKYLVTAGADIHAKNTDVMSYAPFEPNPVIRANNEYALRDYTLRLAAQNGHLEVVKYLVEMGADIHADNNGALSKAVEFGHLEVVKYLHESGANIRYNDDYPIRLAARFGHLEIVKYLHEAGADIRAGRDWALRMAADEGHLEVVKYALQMGADIHAWSDGAITMAAMNGHLDVVKYLHEAGANIHTLSGNHPAVANYISEAKRRWHESIWGANSRVRN